MSRLVVSENFVLALRHKPSTKLYLVFGVFSYVLGQSIFFFGLLLPKNNNAEASNVIAEVQMGYSPYFAAVSPALTPIFYVSATLLALRGDRFCALALMASHYAFVFFRLHSKYDLTEIKSFFDKNAVDYFFQPHIILILFGPFFLFNAVFFALIFWPRAANGGGV
jgi:hypothetical protein